MRRVMDLCFTTIYYSRVFINFVFQSFRIDLNVSSQKSWDGKPLENDVKKYYSRFIDYFWYLLK